MLTYKKSKKNGVNIVSHTDSTGSAEQSQSLSTRRAQSVASYLAANGVASSRISAYGAGPNQPIASNANEAGRAQNRRVEIYVGERPPQGGSGHRPARRTAGHGPAALSPEGDAGRPLFIAQWLRAGPDGAPHRVRAPP